MGALDALLAELEKELRGKTKRAHRSRCTDEEARDDGRARALRGLTNLGFKRGEAARALDTVLERHGPLLASHALPAVLRETLALLTIN